MTAFGRIERALAVQSALNSSGHLGIPSLFIALEIDIVLSPFVSSAISVILFPLNARCLRKNRGGDARVRCVERERKYNSDWRNYPN